MNIIDNQVKIHLLGLLAELYPSEPYDNLFVRLTNNFDYEVGYTNDKPMQHGNGVRFIIPKELVNYILKIRYNDNVATA